MSSKELLSGPVVLLLETDARFESPVREALREIDPQIQLLVLTKIEDVDQALRKESPELAADAVIRGLVLPAEAPSKPEALSQRLPGISLPPILVTCFEHSEKLVHDWALTGVFNLLPKPYDPLLLKQHLRIALHPSEPPKDFATHNLKTSARIEMLKEIPMEAVSEVGIVTRSERDVPLGRVTKLYGKIFGWKDRISVYARAFDQRPHPTRKDEKSVYMTWFGVAREQMLQIRSRFPKEEASLSWRPEATAAQKVSFLILGDPSAPGTELAGTLTRSFSNLEVLSFMDAPGASVPLPETLGAVLFHRSLTEAVLKDARFKNVPKILIATSVPTDEELRADAQIGMDLVTLPTERVSFFKKISLLFPELKPEADIAVHSFRWQEALNVGQPIEITEMSESGLTMKYERPLSLGSVRRFVLWQPVESGLPILTARCYLSRKDQSGQDLNYFVFFGMSDAEIKHIRVWMRDHFIQDKAKSQG